MLCIEKLNTALSLTHCQWTDSYSSVSKKYLHPRLFIKFPPPPCACNGMTDLHEIWHDPECVHEVHGC